MANISAPQIDLEAEELEEIGRQAVERAAAAGDPIALSRLFDAVTGINARYHLPGAAGELLLHLLDQKPPLSAADVATLRRVWERLGGDEFIEFTTRRARS